MHFALLLMNLISTVAILDCYLLILYSSLLYESTGTREYIFIPMFLGFGWFENSVAKACNVYENNHCLEFLFSSHIPYIYNDILFHIIFPIFI